MWLEQPELADAIRGDAAGGKVGHASALELQPDIGDVDFGGQDGDAGGADLLDLGSSQAQQDIDIVDHQVEDHVHIQGARAEDVQAVDFEKQGVPGQALECHDGGIKALQMADLQDAAVRFRGGDEAIGGGDIGRNGLFDEHVDAGFEQRASDFSVRGSGDGDYGGIHAAGQLARMGEGETAIGRRYFAGAFGVTIHDGGQL